MDKRVLFEKKIELIRALIRSKECDGLWLTSVVNVAWLTTGARTFVSIAEEASTGRILITHDEAYLVAGNNEVPRLLDEEMEGLPLKVIEFPWYAGFESTLLPADYIYDDELERELSVIRMQLTIVEIDALRALGQEAAIIVEKCCMEVSQGEREFEIAGRLSKEFWSAGIEPLVMNIAADDRAYSFRHPIATDNLLKKHLALSVCVRRRGLCVTLTRVVHFGTISDDLKKKHMAAVWLDAYAISRTLKEGRVKVIFERMRDMYHKVGYADEWTKHPVGGLIGYKPREFDATENTDHILAINQAFSWNPTIEGTKSEDTIIITEDGYEIVTHTGKYPYVEVAIEGKIIRRPDILIR